MRESRTEGLYRALTDAALDAGLWMGGFFALAGILLLVQLGYSTRQGFVYGYVNKRVYKKESPRSYRIRFFLQAFLSGLLVAGGLLFATFE